MKTIFLINFQVLVLANRAGPGKGRRMKAVIPRTQMTTLLGVTSKTHLANLQERATIILGHPGDIVLQVVVQEVVLLRNTFQA